MDFPCNLFEFGRMFSSETACRDYLIQVRWPDGFQCFCGSRKAYWVPERKAFKCAECGNWTYLTQGTVMEKSGTPICIWFLGAYLVTTMTPGISAVQFQRQAGIKTYETAFQILHKLRAAMVRPERGRLSGKVEADETFIGGKEEGHTGRGVINKTLVAGVVEVRRNAREHAGRVRLRIVPDGSAKSLLAFVMDNVDPGSTVVTDGWPSYNNLSRRGYRHIVAEGADLGAESPVLVHMHRAFSNLKTWLMGTHHGAVSEKHLQAYLNEFTFRFNRRLNPMLAFNTILGLAADAEAPTYEELYAAGKEGGWVHPNPQPEDDA